MNSLDSISQHLDVGQVGEARRELVKLLRIEPRNTAAWMLLATLLDDEDKQADCYRQVLTIEPGNAQASEKLQQLTYRLPPVGEDGTVLCCPQCGGKMNVRFVGQLQDKRAICTYCGTEVDLPDSYQHIERTREHESRPGGGSRTVEKATVQTRSDGPATIPRVSPPQQDIVSRRDTMTYIEQRLTLPQKTRPAERLLGGLIKGLTGGQARAGLEEDSAPEASQIRDLTPADIISLAGGPLPEDQRRKCPKCGATISKSATRCEWCGMQVEPEL